MSDPCDPICDSRMSYDSLIQRNYGVYGRGQQARIHNASAAVVGIGCDGGLAAMILARAGVGRLALIDPDVVEASNLNRQPLFTARDVGQRKVDVARDLLLACNPFIDVDSVCHRISQDSAGLLSGFDVVLQCVDNFPGRVCVHRVCADIGVPAVSMTGQPPYRAHVTTFLPDSPSYESIWALPSAGRNLTADILRELEFLKHGRASHADAHGATPGWCRDYCDGARGWGGEPVGWGITPERAYITATIQAHECLRILTGRPLLAEAPKAVIIDLSRAADLVTVESPTDGRQWDYRQY